MKQKRIDAWLSNLGYCTRGETKKFLKMFEVCANGTRIFNPSTKVLHHELTIEGEMIDPVSLTMVMYKPQGVVCSHKDDGKLIYSLLPQRWQYRNPKIATVGRLDRDTSGIILITDDGELNHKLTSPKNDIVKIYEVHLAHPLKGDEGDIFASGSLMLHGEEKPLLPAKMEVIDETTVRLEIVEGRYHQVKRMFGAVGNRVIKLHRTQFGEYNLEGLKEGEFQVLIND